MGENPSRADVAKMRRLFELGSDSTQLYFLPGDKEWDDGGKKGHSEQMRKLLSKYPGIIYTSGHDHRVATDEYLQARLFDMFITDWDRHHFIIRVLSVRGII